MSRIEKAEFTTMIMIYDDNNNVVVQNRVKSWPGLAFPGGHIEDEESIIDSVIREVKEETGLTVNNLKLCGIKQAFFKKDIRYVVYLYKTNDFEGVLSSNDEGENTWMSIEELKSRKEEMSSTFEYMLEVFLNDELSEHYHKVYDDGKVINIVK